MPAISERHSGTCKWFNPTKGFGFITSSNETKEEFFVHHSEIKGIGFKTLIEGEEVEFDIEVDESQRKKAVNVSGPNGENVKGDRYMGNSRYSNEPDNGSRGHGYSNSGNYGSYNNAGRSSYNNGYRSSNPSSYSNGYNSSYSNNGGYNNYSNNNSRSGQSQQHNANYSSDRYMQRDNGNGYSAGNGGRY